jgi:hypothetical protein
MTTWTRETIYKDPRRPWSDIPLVDLNDLGGRHRYTPEFAAAALSETNWVPQVPVPPSLSPEQWQLVGTKEQPCPLCGGLEESLVERFHVIGATTGIEAKLEYLCRCRKYRTFWRRWLKDVPPLFRDVRLSTTAPIALPGIAMERQAEILAILKENPSGSYFLVGASGTGKTRFATALYREAVWDLARRDTGAGSIPWDGPVWRITATRMIAENMDWNQRNMHDPNDTTPAPTVFVPNILHLISQGWRPRLFIDEIDKFTPNEHRMPALLDIVNVVYEAKGQIVATSNRTFDQLVAAWGGADIAYTILRRIGKDDGAQTLVFGPVAAAPEPPAPASDNAEGEAGASLSRFDGLDDDDAEGMVTGSLAPVQGTSRSPVSGGLPRPVSPTTPVKNRQGFSANVSLKKSPDQPSTGFSFTARNKSK